MDTSLSYWLGITGKWGIDKSECMVVYHLLKSAYGAKNRHYHNLTHIEHMLQLANKVQEQIQDKETMYLAIWFHDAVQKLGRDSEQLSANFAEKTLLKLNAPIDLIDKVKTLILVTKHTSDSRSIENDEKLISDIDLCILGGNSAAYKKYTMQCRKEYFVPEYIYNKGRKFFLQGMLQRNNIFLTGYFKEKFETQAFINMTCELKGIK